MRRVQRWMGGLLWMGLAVCRAGEPALPEPPPYGAYFWNIAGHYGDPQHRQPVADAIARHYGYDDQADALRACFESGFGTQCVDPVAHRRAESPEIAQYGFHSWDEAVAQCLRRWRADFGPQDAAPPRYLKVRTRRVTHCHADPFLQLRLGRR